jgi:hypothetical protein
MDYSEQQQEQQPENVLEQYPFQTVAPRFMNKDNLAQQISPEKTAEALEHFLRGEVYNSREQIWEVKRTPRMNEKGIDAVIFPIKSLLTSNSTLGNLKYKEAKNLIYHLACGFIDEMTMNTKKWEVDKSSRTTIIMTIVSLLLLAISRSFGKEMSDKEMFSTTISSQEHTLVRVGDEKRAGSGFLSALNPLKRH